VLFANSSGAKKWGKALREKKVPLGEYLAFITVKYNIDPDKFFQALVSTQENKKTFCGDLSIECRSRGRTGRICLGLCCILL